jgi:predicted regulator of Ras-like GTPase activity (Roadblock/LC7/MglB family)
VDADGALADLTEISSQIESAVLMDADGAVLASTFPSDAAAAPLARAGRELLDEASGIGIGAGRELTQLEVSLREASVFVVRDGANVVAATTVPEPTSALVLYDLRACLRALAQSEAATAAESEEPAQAVKPRRRSRKTVDA